MALRWLNWSERGVVERGSEREVSARPRVSAARDRQDDLSLLSPTPREARQLIAQVSLILNPPKQGRPNLS